MMKAGEQVKIQLHPSRAKHGGCAGGLRSVNYEVRSYGGQVFPFEMERSDFSFSAGAVLDRGNDGPLHVVLEPGGLHDEDARDPQNYDQRAQRNGSVAKHSQGPGHWAPSWAKAPCLNSTRSPLRAWSSHSLNA